VTLFQAFILGLLQGLAEFLPISSSAHLALTPWLFGWPEPGLAFDVALHVGTLVAVLGYFRAEWARLARAAWHVARNLKAETPEEWRAVYIAIATVPGVIAGVLLQKQAEEAFRAPVLIAQALIVMGVVLWLVDRFAPRDRNLGAIRARDALLIGCAQAFAVVPGVSRSGATISAGRALKLDREAAATFSFLMSMPIIAGAAAFEGRHLIHTPFFGMPLVVGVITSTIAGWFAIAALLRFVTHRSYGIFAAYRLVLGAIVIWIIHARG
jgi:undecaprenyl-diphosphatase